METGYKIMNKDEIPRYVEGYLCASAGMMVGCIGDEIQFQGTNVDGTEENKSNIDLYHCINGLSADQMSMLEGYKNIIYVDMNPDIDNVRNIKHNHRRYEWDRGKGTLKLAGKGIHKTEYNIYNLHGLNLCMSLEDFKGAKLDPRHHIVIFKITPVVSAVDIINKFGFDKYGCLDRDCIYIIADSDEDSGHKKFDDDKLKYDSIPPEFIRMCAEIVSGNITVDLSLIDKSMLLALGSVLTYGAKKYEKENWRLCQELGRYRGATMRHFEAYRAGEVNEAEGEFHHLWHCLTNIAILIGLEAQKEKQNEPYNN